MPARFVDTNVFIYAQGAEHPLRAPCVDILGQIAARPWEGVTSAEVLQELLHFMNRRGRREPGIEQVREVLTMLRILPVTGPDVLLATHLMHTHPHLTPYDALHLAVMQAAGITEIISADKHFDAVPGIRRIDPLTWQDEGAQ